MQGWFGEEFSKLNFVLESVSVQKQDAVTSLALLKLVLKYLKENFTFESCSLFTDEAQCFAGNKFVINSFFAAQDEQFNLYELLIAEGGGEVPFQLFVCFFFF